jgi:hypothetical protein
MYYQAFALMKRFLCKLHLYLLMGEMEHLRQVLDYLPCCICETDVPQEERVYLCTICSRLNRVVSAEKASPKWKIENGKIVAASGIEIDEFKPKINVVVKKETDIKDVKEIEILEIGETISDDDIQIEEELPEWNSIKDVYRHGEYTLYTKEVTFRGGRKQRIYFFSKKKQKDAIPSHLPKGYKIKVNKKTGLPFLTKK